MGDAMLLDELTIIAVLGVVVTVLVSKIRLPTVAGLLLAGALAGPFGLGLVSSVHAIETLAEMGTVLLLFTIGLEFSLERLKHIFKQVAIGGMLQVGLTTGAAAGVAFLCGQPPGRCLFYGFIFALSSTAIVLRALTERRELDAPHGRIIVGTLIFQDLCVVPMALIIPLLGPGQSAGNAMGGFALALLKAAGVVLAIVVIARVVVPRVLAAVDASRSREVFLLAVLALCIGTAWLTSLADLTLALGAFLGGIVVADTEYGHRAMGDILPLRDAFVSIFFVSLGMLFDLHVVLAHPLLVAGLLIGFVLGKGFLATIAAGAMRFPGRVAWLAGVGLGQFGELGFVLVGRAHTAGVVDKDTMAPILAAGIISMFLTPVLMRWAPHFTAGERLLAPLERLIGVRSLNEEDDNTHTLRDHVIIVGFGVAGKLTAQALATTEIPYLVLELNAENVRKAKANDEPIFYGDATSEETLEHAQLKTARALVLLMNDPQGAQRVVDVARRLAPDVHILMRSTYLGEKRNLLKMGASDVVAGEVEGGVELLARLLRWCDVPRNVIDQRLRETRDETQTTERRQTFPRRTLPQHESLAEMKVESVLVTEDSAANGRSAVDLELRQQTQALVVAVRRDGTLMEHPKPDDPFRTGDVVYVVGERRSIDRAVRMLGTPELASA